MCKMLPRVAVKVDVIDVGAAGPRLEIHTHPTAVYPEGLAFQVRFM